LINFYFILRCIEWAWNGRKNGAYLLSAFLLVVLIGGGNSSADRVLVAFIVDTASLPHGFLFLLKPQHLFEIE